MTLSQQAPRGMPTRMLVIGLAAVVLVLMLTQLRESAPGTGPHLSRESTSSIVWSPVDATCPSAETLDTQRAFHDGIGRLKVAPSLSVLRQQLLNCSLAFGPDAWPGPAQVYRGWAEIDSNLRFGRILGCMARLETVKVFMDVFVMSGHGSGNLIGAGLGPGEYFIGQEAAQDRWEYVGPNLARDVARGVRTDVRNAFSLDSVSPPRGALVDMCDVFKVDAMLFDVGSTSATVTLEREIQAAAERKIMIERCKPKLVAVHNVNVHPDNLEVVKTLMDTGRWEIVAHGTHAWPATPQYPCRRWVVLGSADPLFAADPTGRFPLKPVEKSALRAN